MQTDNTTGKKNDALNVVDLFFYLLSRWQWFLLSLVFCVGLAWYWYAKASLVFFRSATVVIKDPVNQPTTSTAGLERFDNYVNKVNVSNELLQFQSKHLMSEVVKRLHVDVDYEVKQGLRTVELYKKSPVEVRFSDADSTRYIAFTVTPKSSSQVVISDIQGVKGAKDTYVAGNGGIVDLGSSVVQLSIHSPFDKSWVGRSIMVRHNPLKAVAERYMGNFGIHQEEDDASILTLSLKDNSPTRATDVLNTLITVYNDEAVSDKKRVVINTTNFINDRLAIIGRELGGVESDLQRYKQSNQIVDVGSSANQYMDESQRYSEDAWNQETQLKLAGYIRDYLIDPKRTNDLIPSNTGIGNASIENQIDQYNSMRLKLDRMITDSGDSNPVVEELNRSLRALRHTIIRAIDNLIVSIQMKRNDAQSRQMRAQSNVTAIPRKERGIISIERQQKIKEELYLFLLNRREENALSQAMVDNNARVIDSADGSDAPISPSRNRILLLGTAAGLILPTVILLLILFLDTRVHTKKDIVDAVTIPFLGEIPVDKELARNKHITEVVNKEDNGLASEAFRILRTNISFMNQGNYKTQVITFTSFMAGAGKTFIALNLALSWVYAQKRVVLLDLDIRKGRLSHHLHKRGNGVTNYLIDPSLTVDDIIQPVENYPNLSIVPCGTIPPNPSELLMSSRLDKLVEELRARYDYIIADNVPLGIVADSSITNRISDLTIFVVRSGFLDRRQLPDIEKLYNDNTLNNMALVLNGVNPKRHGYAYSYGYGYGYGYGYHYGYGHHHENKWYRRLFKRQK